MLTAEALIHTAYRAIFTRNQPILSLSKAKLHLFVHIILPTYQDLYFKSR